MPKLTNFETKVAARLIKSGNNAAWANRVVKENLADVMRMYGWTLTVKEYAEIIRSIA